MHPAPIFRARPLGVALGVITLLGLSACGSADRDEAPPPASALGQPPPVAMAADGLFFDGRLQVEATLSRGRPGGPAGGRGKRSHRGYAPPDMSGGGPPGGMGGMGSGGPAFRRGDDEGGGGTIRLPSGPALTLRMRFENRGKENLEVEILDANSELGNFAVRPERLLLAPGQATEVDPMISQLGVVAETIPLQVALRVAGQKERQTLVLRSPAAAAPP